jgi:hypothetical protein
MKRLNRDASKLVMSAGSCTVTCRSGRSRMHGIQECRLSRRRKCQAEIHGRLRQLICRSLIERLYCLLTTETAMDIHDDLG